MIEAIRLHNFKKFKEQIIAFNNGRNILIGENGVGKSSVLLAISCVLSGSYSVIEKLGLQTLFNVDAIKDFMNSEKKFSELPLVEVELFINNDVNNHEINGKKNSLGIEKNGLKMRIFPNEELSDLIKESLESTNIFPFEYYNVEFSTFSDRSYSSFRKYPDFIKYSYLDSSKVNSNYAMKDYINRIYESKTDRSLRYKINNKYRNITQQFSDNLYTEFALEMTDDLKIKLNTQNENSFQDNITVEKAGIHIENLGQGEKIFINTEFLLTNSSEDSKIVLIEEPENHLSYLNMNKLIDRIIAAGDEKQTFIATHSNMIVSRLDLKNAVFFSEKGITKLGELEIETAPDNNVLNFILSKRAILVEGDAEYISLNEFYNYIKMTEPYNEDITIISCGGKTFKRYLEIARLLKKKVAVITDNDHDYKKNISENYVDFISDQVKIFADEDNSKHTFEVSLYEYNKSFIDTFLANANMNNGVQSYMLNNKAEAAFRLLCLFTNESPETNLSEFKIPSYIEEAIKWITE
ncbi:ATP-dependent nuclease [Schinkia azotoformans]|uniref:ATP-dependent nuclease n=1 Tax=Schinkia azotoformans TaxID=1454 RepID=UPI002DB5E2B0|nr:TOPRIM nucleotidyl transferase/hydrolase domain-containing protein [Schinkia azotoformans]MEC1718940.1 AAA family ATPase [Schinkia azotoformans]MED4412030.1 AAA family ATPase [Schinkia azotoformans]